MDIVDRKLLQAIQRDASLTTDKLAEIVGASASSVQRRLKRFKESGIVAGKMAVLDPKLVGQPLLFIVGLEIERKREDLYQRLRQWIDATDQVQQAYNVTGASDFVLVVSARSVEDYDALMDRMLSDNDNIRKYTTSAVLRTYKRGLFTPVA